MATKKTVAKSVSKRTSKVVIKKTPAGKSAAKKVIKKEDSGLPLSVVIRRRIEAQKARFHANDNISAFIRPGE
jgi:GTP cyclohydrolase I